MTQKKEMIGKDGLSITLTALRAMADAYIKAGGVLGAPRKNKDGIEYGICDSAEEILLTGFIHPRNSIKSFYFPRYERLYRYDRDDKGVIKLTDCNTGPLRQLLVGVRPCDAAVAPLLDHVFHWETTDQYYDRRREATTVIALACDKSDDNCFCTSVNGSPDGTSGSDAILYMTSDRNRFAVTILTEKGAAALANYCENKPADKLPPADVPVRFDPTKVHDWVSKHFDNPFWEQTAASCIGCGICSYTCPTCHCFDIIDEKDGTKGGWRVRNWDNCQEKQFTQHASGHNPRTTQGARQRQRLLHKFCTYPDRFGAVLCTGCGNCARLCPVSYGVLATVKDICSQPN